MLRKLINIFISAFAGLFLLFPLTSEARSQRRDFMTDEEIEIVREAQDIDLRVDALTKMIDRRFMALGIEAGGWKGSTKDSEKWGAAPTGSRLELFTDIRYLMQKAVDDIDDVAEHDQNAQAQNRTTGKLFPKAVRSLAAASQRYLGVLKPLTTKTADDKEKGMIFNTIELCEQVVEAAATLPTEKPKGKN